MKSKLGKWTWYLFKRLSLIVFVVYAFACTMFYSWQTSMIFPGTQLRGGDAKPPAGTIILTRTIDEGNVEAWFSPAATATPENPAPVVFFFHGNYELVDEQRDIIAGYNERGVSVALVEYRGYGRSAGKPGQDAITEDAVYFCDQITAREDVDAKRVIIHGRSVGGAVAAQLAGQRPPQLLILQSTMTSIARMARGYLMPSFLVKHPFRTDEVLEKIDCPVLIFHGKRDEIIPVSHGRKLAGIAGDSTYVEFNIGHNDPPPAGEYWAAIEKAIAETIERP